MFKVLERSADRLNSFLLRLIEIYRKESIIGLFKRIPKIIYSSRPYESSTFFVHERRLIEESEADFIPKISNPNVFIFENKHELLQLHDDGFNLSLLNITQAKKRLELGAILLLIFKDTELIYREWIALNEVAKNSFNDYPYKVDFPEGEACNGEVWTNPKYRKQGLFQYAGYKRGEFLRKTGVKKLKSIVLTNNNLARKSFLKQPTSRVTAEARYLRVFCYKSWKETPVN